MELVEGYHAQKCVISFFVGWMIKKSSINLHNFLNNIILTTYIIRDIICL